MTKYQILVALLGGLGFVSVVCLLMNLPVLNALLLLVVSPGATALRMLPGSLSNSIPKILVANVLIYSLIVLIVIFFRFRDVQVARLRQIAIGMILPVTVTSCLAFFTSFNPLLPKGMRELSRQELGLQQALPLGMGLQESRSLLVAKGIQFHESLTDSELSWDEAPDTKISLHAGDRVLSSRFRTPASSYPCTYDMKITLVFGQDERLKDRYIHRAQVCP